MLVPIEPRGSHSRDPDLELYALCDAEPEALRRAGEAYGVGRMYGDFGEMLDQAKPHLLGIATRTPGRAEIIRCAAAGGVRALHIEKPLCSSMAELRSLTRGVRGGRAVLHLRRASQVLCGLRCRPGSRRIRAATAGCWRSGSTWARALCIGRTLTGLLISRVAGRARG